MWIELKISWKIAFLSAIKVLNVLTFEIASFFYTNSNLLRFFDNFRI